MDSLIRIVVLAPFLSAALLFFLRKRIPPQLAGLIGCASILTSFVCTVVVFFGHHDGAATTVTLTRWMQGSVLDVAFAFRVDPLSLTWTLVVTGVGFLIHVYSVGYMHADPGFTRFFTYLNLFVGAMLALVLGDSMPLLFLGWEGVGLCSYLLIGFWFAEMENAHAGQKAFVVNRIGDLGFLLGMAMIFARYGTLKIDAVVSALAADHAAGRLAIGDSWATGVALLLFLGACGKSAQIPLYTWLPDAMAGPTPVSALIHAATMVTAGVYMVARMSVLFALSPVASTTVAVVGTVTAFFAATIALRQRDIKRVLAYSTVSQLGFMFLGLGVGAHVAAVFHVITHAFFKALLFLGAGSVIHALSGEQDAMKMGGLKPHLPKTHLTFLIGCLALAGIAPFAGFFSKDQILGTALLGHGTAFALGVVGLITALMTAFYTFRLYSLVFKGTERLDHHAKEHMHESPASMTMPLQVLALLAAVGGVLSLPHFLHIPDFLGDFLAPVFEPARKILGEHAEHGAAAELGLLMLSLVLAVAGAWFGAQKYAAGPGKERDRATQGLPFVVENKWFVDEIYAIFIVGPMRALAFLAGFLDRVLIDGLVNGLARGFDSVGATVRRLQNGQIHTYALLFLAGAVLLALSLL